MLRLLILVLRWQKRSLDEHFKNINSQAMYGIVHGGMNEDMRRESAEYINSLGFDGTAIGGSLGKDREDIAHMINFVTRFVNYERPIHLLGIGDLESISHAVTAGIDTFDSSYPTKYARHGLLFIE